MKHLHLPLLLASFGLGAVALPVTGDLDPRQTSPFPYNGTCTVADNTCHVVRNGVTSNWICGQIMIIAGPTLIYEPERCTVEGHVRILMSLFQSATSSRLLLELGPSAGRRRD
ncbi:hypothetical protein B0H66DRAFT_169642 [Apodospora peruviana]|uniref:Uncharacterized protein n=1 Tax=Apodospora peruviana TaxID=516989 RepID=A0AAE0IKX5_9PEZI|nr:hypothetical protein B0H66DRAFT_169642 [Apodospora peruviana]